MSIKGGINHDTISSHSVPGRGAESPWQDAALQCNQCSLMHLHWIETSENAQWRKVKQLNGSKGSAGWFFSDPGLPRVRSMGPVVCNSLSPRGFADLTNVTLADEDSNSIPTHNVSMAIQYNAQCVKPYRKLEIKKNRLLLSFFWRFIYFRQKCLKSVSLLCKGVVLNSGPIMVSSKKNSKMLSK